MSSQTTRIPRWLLIKLFLIGFIASRRRRQHGEVLPKTRSFMMFHVPWREKTHPSAASERDHIRPIYASCKWEALSFMNILPRRPFTTKRTRNGRGKSIPGGSCSRQVVIVFDAVLPARYTIHQTKLPSLIFRVRELNSIVAAADGDILHQQIPLLPFGISTPQGGDAVEQTFARVLI